MSIQSRNPAGSPGSTGGQFAPTRAGEADVNLTLLPALTTGVDGGIEALSSQLPADVTAVLLSEEDTGLEVVGLVRRGERIGLDEADLDDPEAFIGDVRHYTAAPGGSFYTFDEGLGAYRLAVRPDPWGRDEVREIPPMARQAILDGDANLLIECWDATESGGEPLWRPTDGFRGEDRYDFKQVADYAANCLDFMDPPLCIDVIDHESGGGVVVSVPLEDGSGMILAHTLDDDDLSSAERGVRGRAQAVGHAEVALRSYSELREARARLVLS